ncbi:MAG: PH domain-containing protein [Legionella sp.]|uniref:PH domain-containing protein n=1 Tax=Legionella sp. TaxID=459 RepID=UPI0039E5E48C
MIENLKKDKNVVYFTRMHWIIFSWPLLGLIGALALVAFIPPLREVGYGLTVFTLVWLFMTWVTYYFSSLTIKTNQVILRTGVVVRQTIDIPLSKIEAIDIRQSILGSILRYGMVCITGTGGTRRMINYLSNPLTCRRYIEQLMTELHNKS